MKKILAIFSILMTFSFCSGIIQLDINGYSASNAPNPLDIESYIVGNNEVVHPDVHYFENGWNGYEYWMVYTPFPSSDAQYENPSIAVSHDGLVWEVPAGLTNPIMTPFPETYDANNYYHSDPDMVMSEDNSIMYVFWREHSGWRDETLNYVYSTDGLNWSANQMVFVVNGSNTERILSPAIVRDNDNFKMWTVNTKTSPRTINLRTTDNLTSSWSNPIATDLTMITPTSEIWHLDVTFIEGKYYMLASVGMAGTTRGGSLYLAVSDDGLTWEVGQSPILSGDSNSWDSLIYRSSIMAYPINNHLNFKVWYSSDGGTATDNLLWKIGYTEFIHEDTPDNILTDDLVISEVMYDNSSLTGAEFLDEYGLQSDWIELYNRGTNDIDIADYYLSDDNEDLTKWRIPQGIIAPNERLVVWCNNEDNVYNNSLNTNFKLKNGGESVYLTFVDHITVIDSVRAIEIPEDYSFGRASFDSNFLNVLATPTPGSANEIQDSAISVILTEVMSSNKDFMFDENGENSDWLEIKNEGLFPINLNYFNLSDDPSEPNMWNFDNIALLPNEYHVVWASGKNTSNHTNFSISANGEDVILTGRDNIEYSAVAVPTLNANESYALGELEWEITATPSPYHSNLFANQNDDLFINEVMANGLALHLDANGRASDWLEIYNSSVNPLDLTGMFLSDDWTNYTKWTFPQLEILPGEVALVWCSGDDTIYPNNEIHTNFSISSNGEEVFLVDSDGNNIIDTFYAYPTSEDISLGRYPNGYELVYEYLTPSPNLLNPIYELPEIPIYINEVMASNSGYYHDINGDDGDWFELINYGTQDVDLAGLYLSDDPNNLGKWEIPARTLTPNEIIIFWADNADMTDDNNEMHTNFKLSSSETLYLAHVDSISIIDSIPVAVIGENAAMARKWDNIALWEETLTPTPNNRNELSYNLNQAIFINEICSDNGSIITDIEGDYSDWIEIWNQKDYPINLRGFGLTDDITQLDKWLFPNTILEANSYMLIWCSSNDSLYSNSELHSNFKISGAGEDIALSFINSQVIDEVDAIYIPEDNSYGRISNHTSYFAIFTSPTPGIINESDAFPILEECSVDINAGFYEETQVVTLTNPNANGTIYYTLDGSTPTESSNVYTGPLTIASRMNEANVLSEIRTTIPVSSSEYQQENDFWVSPQALIEKATVLKCLVMGEGYDPSQVVTKTYFVGQGITTRFDLSVMSISTDYENFFGDDSGIYVPGSGFVDGGQDEWQESNYYQSGIEWEREVYLEYFDAGLELSMSRKAGARIHGGASTRRNRKSLRLYARDEYGGDSFEYQLFPDNNQTEFHKFIVRNSGQDSNKTNFRDAYIHTLAKGTNINTMDYKPIVLFLNGEYWGLHNIRNRFDEDHVEEVYGVSQDEVDIIAYANSFVTENGTNTAFNELRTFLENNDLADADNFQFVEDRVDLDNFLDYYITEIYAANYDWPYNNLKIWRKNGPNIDANLGYGHDGKWRWFLYDLDSGLGEYSGTANANTLEDATTWHNNWQDKFRLLARSLIGDYPENSANPNPKSGSAEFRDRFINRTADLLNTNFRQARAEALIEEMKARINHEMEFHTQRWSSPEDMTSWNTRVDALRDFVEVRIANVQEHYIDKFPFIDGVSNVSLDVNDEAQGIIQISSIVIDENCPGVDTDNLYPWNGDYFNGVAIQITAIPKAGYVFAGWTGQVLDSEETITLTLTQDISLTANFISSTAPVTSLLINELLSKNDNLTSDGFVDYFGTQSDWIEIYNNGDVEVQLNNYYLSDDSTFLNKWIFPEYLLPAGEFVQIWASDQNVVAANGEIHTNFKISAGGEDITLTRVSDNTIIDQVPAYAITPDNSYGRNPDGADIWQEFTSPTPGFSNSQVALTSPEISILENNQGTGLTISWEPVLGANGYKIYMSDSPTFDLINEEYIYTSETEYTVNYPTTERIAFFRVVATTDEAQARRVIRTKFKSSSLKRKLKN